MISDLDETNPGTEWERVARLCDFNPKSSKQAKDVSRMRSVLISLKQSPLVRQAAKAAQGVILYHLSVTTHQPTQLPMSHHLYSEDKGTSTPFVHICLPCKVLWKNIASGLTFIFILLAGLQRLTLKHQLTISCSLKGFHRCVPLPQAIQDSLGLWSCVTLV